MCEKCQDTGIIAIDKAGIMSKFCDCEIGQDILEKKRAIYGIPEEETDGSGTEAIDSGTRFLDSDTGSPDTSESQQPKKPRKKKKARKRAK